MKKLQVLIILVLISINGYSQYHFFNIGKNSIGNTINNVELEGIVCDIAIDSINDGAVQKFTITPSERNINRSLADEFITAMRNRYNITTNKKTKSDKRCYIKEKTSRGTFCLYYPSANDSAVGEVSLRVTYNPNFSKSDTTTTFYPSKLKKGNLISDVFINGIRCDIRLKISKENYIEEIRVFPYVKILERSLADGFITAMKNKYNITASHRGSIKDGNYTIWENKDNVVYFLHYMKQSSTYNIFLSIMIPEDFLEKTM